MRTIKQEQYFPILMLAMVALWGIDLALHGGDLQFSTQQLVGEMLASWVITVLAINFLMATRARWVETIFGGLDKMYMIHRRAGYFAVGFLLLHYLVIPRTSEFSPGKPMGFFALLFILIGVVLASAPAMRRKLPYHKWANMHRTMGLLYILGIVHSFFVPTLTSQLALVKLYVYGWALIGLLAWIFRVFFYNRYHPKLIYTIADVKHFDNDVTQIHLTPESRTLTYIPGQFTFLSIKGQNHGEAHPYTISSHPQDSDLRFSIKALGDYTSQLQSSLQVGIQATVQGVFGAFSFTTCAQTKQIWLAGGIGITPFLAFIKEVSPQYEISLVWSVNTISEANYRTEIERIASTKGNIRFVLWNTDEKGKFVIDKFMTSASLQNCAAFICGPVAMREAYIDQLLEKGVGGADIHYEEFSFR